MNASHFADAGKCQPRTTQLREKGPVGVSAFCTQKPQIRSPFNVHKVYRMKNVTGVYRLSNRESHICYNAQVFPNMINPTQLSGGKYYEIVY